MVAEEHKGVASWGATVGAPTGPAPPEAGSRALTTLLELEERARVARTRTAAEASAEAAAAAVAACHVDPALVTTATADEKPQLQAGAPGAKGDRTA